MNRILNFIIPILILSCSGPNKENELIQNKNINSLSKYPAIIDSMSLNNKYDEAKWRLYCIYCDDTVKLRKVDYEFKKTFGSLELRFDGVERKNDSVELNFYFYIDSIRCDLESVESFGNKFFSNGVLFIKDSLVRYTTPTSMKYFWLEDSYSRFFSDSQPEVLEFIKNNKENLNKWFRDEAKRRKII